MVVLLAGLACAPVASAQYDDPPPYCAKPKIGYASDNDGMEKYASVSGIFRIDFDAKVEKCGNKSRVLYHVYWDATALQSGNHILAHTSSVRSSDGRRQTACVKKGGCTFQLDSGTKSSCCYRPRVQYRTTAGRSYIKSARMDFAVEECGAGCNLRSLPYNKDFKVKYR
jgi:hypothetical protein